VIMAVATWPNGADGNELTDPGYRSIH